MSWKSVDMQLALSRANHVGHLQNQLNHKPKDDLTMLESAAVKQIETERKKTDKVDDQTELLVRDEQEGKEQRRQEKESGAKRNHPPKKQDSGSNEHPYKGHHIDITY